MRRKNETQQYCQCGRKKEEHSNEAISGQIIKAFDRWNFEKDAEISKTLELEYADEINKIESDQTDQIV